LARVLRILNEILLIGIVAFAVLAFGGTKPWTWLVIELGVALALIIWALRQAFEGRISYVKTPLNLLVLLLLALILFQMLPLPTGLIRRVQPNTATLYTVGPPHAAAMLGDAAATSRRFASLSLNREVTRSHFFLYLSYAGLFFLLLNTITTRQQLARMVATVLVVGGVVALSGLATASEEERLLYRMYPVGGPDEHPTFLNADANPEFSAGYGFVFPYKERETAVTAELPEDQKKEVSDLVTQFSDKDPAVRRQAVLRLIEIGPGVLPQVQKALDQPGVSPEVREACQTVLNVLAKGVDWFVPKVHGGDVFGGFPSSNSAATVLLMTVCLGLGVFFAYISTRRTEWKNSGGLFYSHEGNITMLMVIVVGLLVFALVLTKSRGALGCLVPMALLTIVLCAFSRSWLAGLITLAVLAGLVIVPVAVIGPHEVAGFINEKAAWYLNPWDDVRLLARESSMQMFRDFPVFGTGLATYASVYPLYKTGGPMMYFAHCDVLQWMAEMGLAGSGLALLILLTGLGTVVWGWIRLKDSFFRRLLVGSAVGCAAFLAHGLVDFPLQIPGVAVVFVTMAAICVIVARDQVARHEEHDFIF
jgi:hypothetical protein